ncbi:hypothetical protein [Neisseria shayeganii]|uniref:Uncharacterized protein n=1 Tax=Neisseria shayeganii TaxID=607712 RepID=A0A7D7SIE6_9NEIS|nr:hypothetical protein [Neisseria shayeganii]QMT41309.1 hypothetical protein H3L94_04595 [Neisseria shayeganii]
MTANLLQPLWFWLTVAAAKLGQMWMRASFPEKKWAGAAGAFIGFMLLMGGWWVYWGVEYLQVRAYAKEMCQQAGVKVYITPEEWKEIVGGEEIWREIQPIDQSPTLDMQGKTLTFNHINYEISHQVNNRVFTYTRYKNHSYLLMTDKIYYDRLSQKVLFQYIEANIGTSSTDLIAGLKFWIDAIPSCKNRELWIQYKMLYFFKS